MASKRKTTGQVWGIVLLCLSIFLCLGTKFLFHACEAGEDGSWMACHWAEQAAAGTAAVLTVQAVLLLIIKDAKEKAGIAFSMAAAALLAAAVPGGLIRLCMMADMQCRAVMRPAVTVLGILIALTALAAGVVMQRKSRETDRI